MDVVWLALAFAFFAACDRFVARGSDRR